MPLINMTDLRASLRRGQRLVGIDPGERTLGIALSDVMLMLASPYAQWPRGKLAPIAMEIRRLAQREGVGGLVVGLPLSMDGTLGPAGQAARDWAHAIQQATGLPTAQWDERLSTAAVQRQLLSEDASRARRTAHVDRMAAAWMLQSALDATAPPDPLEG